MMNNTILPMRIQLNEEGYWLQTMGSANPSDEKWCQIGWRAMSYEGQVFFRHEEKAVVEQWLADQGYVASGNGVHYQKQEQDSVSHCV